MEEFGAAPDVFVTAGKPLTELKFYLRKYIFGHSPLLFINANNFHVILEITHLQCPFTSILCDIYIYYYTSTKLPQRSASNIKETRFQLPLRIYLYIYIYIYILMQIFPF